MGNIFITGATGYLGSYVLDHLSRHHPDARFTILTRAKDIPEAEEKLWRGLQLHQTAEEFWETLGRVTFALGDLTAPGLGLDEDVTKEIVQDTESILHIAASLNRKSEKACLNANLRGSLHVAQFARAVEATHGLRRLTQVSTVAVAGKRHQEVVEEDTSIDWNRSDYDPYARTKKYAEYLFQELLPNTPRLVLRPSIVMGDSRHERTSQFDMVRAFCALADLPVLPMDPNLHLDIVNADFVGAAIATLHQKATLQHTIYHLSSGTASPTAGQVAQSTTPKGKRVPTFLPSLEPSFRMAINGMNSLPARTSQKQIRNLAHMGALLKVFWPYVTFDTVFNNQRVIQETNLAPTSFTSYGRALYQFATKQGFKYPYAPLPERRVHLKKPAHPFRAIPKNDVERTGAERKSPTPPNGSTPKVRRPAPQRPQP